MMGKEMVSLGHPRESGIATPAIDGAGQDPSRIRLQSQTHEIIEERHFVIKISGNGTGQPVVGLRLRLG